MKKMKLVLALFLALGLNSVAQAATKGYGAAGCGLGAVILGDRTGIEQIFATTLNGVMGNQTFGISFGTLNCGAGGAAPTAQAYIDTNRAALATDMARGNGETLTGLTQLMGCKNTANAGAILQKNYSRIFPNNAVNSASIEQSVKTVLQGQCS
jgi:hypothetical protein